jgi:hypothetical protein
MVKGAEQDCMAKSLFAAARLSDVVRGVKDDCKIEISLVAIYVVMACNHCSASAKFSYLIFFLHPVPLVMLCHTTIILELYRACASTKYAVLPLIYFGGDLMVVVVQAIKKRVASYKVLAMRAQV